MVELAVDVEKTFKENNFRRDADRAMEYFLSANEGDTFVLFPRALNPFLKAIEGLGKSKQILIIPSADIQGRPFYTIMKIAYDSTVRNVSVE